MSNSLADEPRVAVSGADAAAVRAVSRDGRTFIFEPAGTTPLLPGDVVVLQSDRGPYVGQVMDQHVDSRGGVMGGGGLLIGVLDDDGGVQRRTGPPFASAAVHPASPPQLEAIQRSRDATLPIGTWSSCGTDVPARLRAQGFGRHTFLCGQSGSGKTYALGVILEQLMLGTGLRMVVLDPNADFVRLGEARPDAPAPAARRIASSRVRVLGAEGTAAEPLRMRFATMPQPAQAAVLRLDPLADRGEYNQFLHLMADFGPGEVADVVDQLRLGGPDAHSLAERLENLGLLNWEVWAGKVESAAEVMGDGPGLTVLDLSGFRTPQEPVAVCLDLVEELWAHRKTRVPTLIVVDEAHNICPSQPSSSIHEALVERFVQIAAEGRKYGLWLLLSTQRPSKIHPQVLSQCDNLVLMRMNSPVDIAELGEAFGFAPPAMMESSRFFALGEALVAGGFVPVPSMVRIGPRLTHEGGSDVPVPGI
jgi:uncharacterized protein